MYAGVAFLGTVVTHTAATMWKSILASKIIEVNYSTYYYFPIVFLVEIIAIVLSIWMYKKLGTRINSIINGILIAIGLIIATFNAANASYLVYITGTFIGVGYIMCNLMNPLYISHISMSNTRNSYGIFHFIGLVIGSISGFRIAISPHWKIFSYVYAAISIIQSILTIFIPNMTPETSEELQAPRNVKLWFHTAALTLLPFLSGLNAVPRYCAPIVHDHSVVDQVNIVNIVFYVLTLITIITIIFTIYFFGLRKHWIVSSIFVLVFLIIVTILNFMNKSNIFRFIMGDLFNISMNLGLSSVGLSLICQFSDNLIFFSQILNIVCESLIDTIHIFLFSKIWLIIFIVFGIFTIVYGFTLFPELKNIQEKEKSKSDNLNTPII